MNIVLVPGFMTDRELWADLVPLLPSHWALRDADATAATIPEMAEAFLADAPERFALIGFSMGGYVAREIARRAPLRVEALVLIATSARADTPEQTRSKAASLRALDPVRFHGLSRTAVLGSLHPRNAGDPLLVERIRAMSERVGAEVFRRQAAHPRESDLDRLRAIECPTLVVAADADALRSLDEAKELRDGIPRATLQTIEASGHMIPMEQPAALAAAIVPWLAANAASR